MSVLASKLASMLHLYPVPGMKITSLPTLGQAVSDTRGEYNVVDLRPEDDARRAEKNTELLNGPSTQKPVNGLCERDAAFDQARGLLVSEVVPVQVDAPQSSTSRDANVGVRQGRIDRGS
jgi:hypothetical protein